MMLMLMLPLMLQSDGDHPKWTYTLEDGKCTNSLALQVTTDASREPWPVPCILGENTMLKSRCWP